MASRDGSPGSLGNQGIAAGRKARPSRQSQTGDGRHGNIGMATKSRNATRNNLARLREAIATQGNVPRHRAVAAERRLRHLERVWKAERAAGYRDRRKTKERVIRKIKAENPAAAVSLPSLQLWEKAFCEHGPIGLLQPFKQRESAKAKQSGQAASVEQSIKQLANHMDAATLRKLARQLNTIADTLDAHVSDVADRLSGSANRGRSRQVGTQPKRRNRGSA